MTEYNETALVLEGGGNRGVFTAGVLDYLMEQLEKVLKDYFDLSARVKEMHTEIFSLREQLAQAATLQCVNKECLQRTQSEASISEA